MVKRVKTSGEKRGRSPNARPTIGLLLDETMEPVSWAVWLGVDDVARERGANVICFVGRALHAPGLSQANALYGLVSPENLDGLVIWGGGLAQYTDPEEIRILCEQYRPLPMVNAALPLEGIPSVTVDNFQGMRDAIVHLIEVHGFRRIAFIRGPEGHSEAEDRYRAYVSTLADYGLPLDLDLIAPGEFSTSSGMAAIGLLLDQRKVSFEAVVGVDDATAIGATEALQARGIHVPGDVAVVGFDNEEDSWYVTPPLTTVALLGYEQGRRATEMVLALLQGEEVPEQVILPTEVVIRQSCGCLAPEVVQAATGVITKTTSGTFETAFAAQREHILSEMVQLRGASGEGLDSGWAVQLLDAFAAELGGGSSGAFLAVLDDVLRQTVADGMLWQGALSVLRHHALSCLSDDKLLTRAEDLWQQARVMIGRAAERARAYQASQVQRQAETLREVGQSLIALADRAKLMNILAQELPRLGIPSCYVSLYEPGPELAEGDPQSPAEWSRLMLAYSERGRVPLEADGQRFPSRQLVPDGLLPRDRAYSMIAEPLYFREAQLGFALFEMGPRQGIIYETLREQISGGLGVLLAQQMESRALRLRAAAAVSRAASSILDPDELTQQVVDLVRERFDLYYAGLFLVDETGEWTGEPGKWAVLRAGTGEAGRQMLERKHKLEIGGTSMIGWCVANHRARIALDVGEEAVRFENPFLPETRSELALPLVSRGQVIGALTIQSAQEAAFSDEDIATLQTMADQLANAIENAHLFEQSQTARQQAEDRVHEVQILQRIGQTVSSSLDLDYVLDTLVNVLADELKFTYIALNLIDRPSKTLRTVRAIGQAQGLRGLARSMDQLKNDILMDVVRSRQIEVIDGWDDRFDRELFEREGHAALVRAYVPLLLREEAIGILEVGYRRVERARITYAEIHLLRGLVDQIAVAIENARLFQQAQTRAEELTILNEVSRDLAATLDVEMVIQSLYHYASRLMDATNFYVALYDPQRDEVTFPLYAEGQQVRHLLEGRRAGNGLTEYVLRSGRPLLIPDNIPDEMRALGCDLVGQDAQSWLGVPMMIGQRAIGVVAVQSYTTPQQYNEHHRDLLTAIASQAAIAVENARLLGQARVHADELAVINEIGQTLTARLSVEEVLSDIHRAASRLLDATNFYVAFYDADKHQVVFPFDTSASDDERRISMPADRGLTGYVIRNRVSVLIKENLPERLAEMGIELVGRPALSWLGVPMILGEQVLGMMSVQNYAVPRAYDEHDLELLTALASQMAIALQNARLFEEAGTRARQERVIREISDQMQRAADMETLMRITAEELNRALGGSRTYVRLHPEAQHPVDGDGLKAGGNVDEG